MRSQKVQTNSLISIQWEILWRSLAEKRTNKNYFDWFLIMTVCCIFFLFRKYTSLFWTGAFCLFAPSQDQSRLTNQANTDRSFLLNLSDLLRLAVRIFGLKTELTFLVEKLGNYIICITLNNYIHIHIHIYYQKKIFFSHIQIS